MFETEEVKKDMGLMYMYMYMTTVLTGTVNNGWTVDRSGKTVDKPGWTVVKPKAFKP